MPDMTFTSTWVGLNHIDSFLVQSAKSSTPYLAWWLVRNSGSICIWRKNLLNAGIAVYRSTGTGIENLSLPKISTGNVETVWDLNLLLCVGKQPRGMTL